MNPSDRARWQPFLDRHGLTGEVELTPLREGGNNRVIRVRHASGLRVLKCYFHNPADPRDRFGAERAFYEFLRQHGIRCTPQAIGWDPDRRLGLFEYVTGRKLEPAEITGARVDEALEFVLVIDTARRAGNAPELPRASEACFSLVDHLATVTRRVARLGGIVPHGDVERQAIEFVKTRLGPAWEHASKRISAADSKTSIALPPKVWCLSPSDFGFHNALLGDDGRLRFLDFEYAGWDDPAKLVCDFFCQPELPVDLAHWDRVTARLAAQLVGGEQAITRAQRLLPAYQIKWCCIMLNEFLEVDAARRAFAGGTIPSEERKARQLAKARAALDRIQED
jgi:hypothetical protein